MTEPLVSVVIPVFNGANYLACAIESALSQTYPHCETIVVNDGSTDDGATERIALSFGDRIRYFSKENGGVASALNLGIQKMRGDYFCWLSHDDYYLPDKVLHELQTIPPQYPDTLVYSDYVYLDTVTGHRLPVQMEKWCTERQLSTPLFPVMFQLIHGCATMIHRSHFDRVGLFDEAQRTTQDYDMWFRLFRNSRIRHCPHCDMTARLHPNAGNQTIPEFIDNACDFMIRTDRMLTDAERAEISGTPYRYYRQMYATIANTKYDKAKRYFAEAVAQGRFAYHCQDTAAKRKLLEVLLANCGMEPFEWLKALQGMAGNDAALDIHICQAMKRYCRMPQNRIARKIHRPQWSFRTRVLRILLEHGWGGITRKVMERVKRVINVRHRLG